MATPIMLKCKLNGNVIDIQGNSTKSGALLDAFTPKAGQSLNGPTTFAANQAWEVAADPAGSSHHIIQNPATGYCIDIQGNSTHAGASLDAYPKKTSDNQNQLWDFLPDPYGSGYFFIQNPQTGYVIEIKNGSSAAGAVLVVNPRRLFGNNFQLWAGVQEDWAASTLPALTLAAAPAGFGSNAQYVLLAPNQNTNLKSITVALDIIEDLVADSFSVQINGNAPYPSPKGVNWDAQWIQFALLMQNNGLYLWNQAWHALGPDQKGDPLASQPITSAQMLQLQNNTVPKGTRIVLTLTVDANDDDFVTAVAGQVFANGTAVGKAQTLSLINQPTFNPGGPVKEADLAPWGALSVVVVGAPGGNATFLSGMGTITVTCDPAVTVSSQLNGPNPHGIQTGEQSNCYYGQVQQGSFKQIVQPFGLPSPKFTSVSGDYAFAGTGLLPNSKLKATATFQVQNTSQTVGGSISPAGLESQSDGSFGLLVTPQNSSVLYEAGTVTVTVTDADGNWAKGATATDVAPPLPLDTTGGLRA